MTIRILPAVLALSCLCAAAWATEARTSYANRLDLETAQVRAPHGLDIWLTRDGGRTWILAGRTFTEGESWQYTASAPGAHAFHLHARRGPDDAWKPGAGASLDRAFDVVLEDGNDRILYANRRELDVQYEARDASQNKADITEAHLYYTTNSGLTWNHYGRDPDGLSPAHFSTGEDGLYGFRVVSTNRAQLKEMAPGPGALPDILVRVDMVPPEPTLLSPQPYDLWEAGTMRNLRWTARDEALEPAGCIGLSYAIGAPVDWKEIAQGLPASGSLPWTVPASDNGRIFMKITCVDRAGNVAAVVPENPFFTRNILEELLAKEVREQADRYYETATICRTNDDLPKAVKYYRLCLQLNPYHVRCHNDFAATLNQMGRPMEAFLHFESGLKYAPSHEGLLHNLASLYISHHQEDIARKLLARLLSLHPESLRALWLASQEATGQGDMERARAYWKRILDLDVPDNHPDKDITISAKHALFVSSSDTSISSSSKKSGR